MISYEMEVLGEKYELAGTHGPSVVSGNTGNPKNRAQFSLNYDRGPLALTASVNWVDSYSATDPALNVNDCSEDVALALASRQYFQGQAFPANYCRIPSFATTNLNATYKVNDNLTLRASILNVFDKQPPIDVATYGNAGPVVSYNASLHQAGAVGRFFSLGANYAF
jgi:iron complex outermembrane recepter protein